MHVLWRYTKHGLLSWVNIKLMQPLGGGIPLRRIRLCAGRFCSPTPQRTWSPVDGTGWACERGRGRRKIVGVSFTTWDDYMYTIHSNYYKYWQSFWNDTRVFNIHILKKFLSGFFPLFKLISVNKMLLCHTAKYCKIKDPFMLKTKTKCDNWGTCKLKEQIMPN